MKKRFINYLYFGLIISIVAGCGGNNNSNHSSINGSDSLTDGIKVMNNLSKTEISKVLSAREEMYATEFFNDDAKQTNSKIKINHNSDDMFVITDDLYVMNEFPETSNNASYVENRVDGILLETSNVTSSIADYKNRVSVSDAWVTRSGVYKYELLDSDNENITLYRKNDLSSDMFSYNDISSYGDGRKQLTSFVSDASKKAYTQSIEGQAYKAFDLFDNRSNYISYDNTLGYWQFFSSGRIEDDNMSFSSYSLCENLMYEVVFVKDNSSDEMRLYNISIISPDGKFDVLRYSQSGFTLYLSGFTGVDRIEKKIENGKLSDNGVTLLDDIDVYFENGDSMKIGDTFVDGKLIYNDGYGVDPDVAAHTSPSLEFVFNSPSQFSLMERFDILNSFLSETGMTSKINLDLILSEVEKINFKAEHLEDSYKWNGYGLNTHSSLESALEAELNKVNTYMSLHESVKNKKVVTYSNDDKEYVYAKLSGVESFIDSIQFIDNKLVINGLRFKVNDFNSLDSEVDYVLNVALSKGDKHIISKVLTSSNNDKYRFNSDNQEIYINGEYLLDEHLDSGSYDLVAYLTTEDGIRSTQKVLLNGTIDDTITNQTKIITVKSENNIKVTYDLNRDQIINPTKEFYTYETLREEMALYAFENDYEPSLIIEINELDTYREVSPEEAIANGTYRMYFTTGQSSEGGYIYINI